MSYRSFKRALGETNLERKCRLLFGTCLLILISASFWWYSTKADEMMFSLIGEELATAVLVEAHFIHQESDPMMRVVDRKLAYEIRDRQYEWEALWPKNEKGFREPKTEKEWELMDQWLAVAETLNSDEDIEKLETLGYRQLIEKPISPRQDDQLGTGGANRRLVYQYYKPFFAKSTCVECHDDPAPVARPDLEVGDLIAIMRVDIEAEEIRSAQHRNHAILAVAAIATVVLAMMALYVIVRYIIVKPLRHLRDVSNAVRSGDVEQRAVIHTGDEFEELGAAFNRMLRQLLRQQDALRSVNNELDGKLDELAQANMRLFEMNQLKSDFLATVSHELRTPLNSIIGFSDLLSSVDGLDEKQLRYATNIQQSGRKLLDMINDILDLAKIESGKMKVRLSQFDVDRVIKTQCDLARPLSNKKNIDLETEIAPGLPPMEQDQGKLEQILNNLLSNAIKFTPDGGRITVGAHRDRRGDLRMTVSDTGVGISESEQVLVFEKFRQGTTVLPAGTAMTREYSGTGLGLSIVRELCRLLGGDITLESELGKGSTFTVHLPWTLTELPKLESPLAEELRKMTKPRLDGGLLPAPTSTASTDIAPVEK